MRRPFAILTAALAAALASAGTAGATTLYVSTRGGNTLNGSAFFRGGDIVGYEEATGTVTPIFNEDTFAVPGPGPEVDAFELLPDGRMIFSTLSLASLGGVIDFVDGDIVEYDPGSGLATLIFQEQPNFNGQADVDAVAVLPNGHILFSTEDNESLTGGPAISDGDVVEWDPVSDTLVGIYLSEALFFGGQDVDIDAFDVTPDGGAYAFSLQDDANILGLGLVSRGDLVRWDLNTLTADIWLDHSLFSDANSPLDAVAVPEPGSSALLALGLVGLALAGRRRPR